MTSSKLMFWKKTAKSKDVVLNHDRGKYRRFFSQVSGAFMLPISVMSVAGLFLGIGAAINSNASDEGLKTFGQFIQNIGDPIFGAMPALFLIAMIVSFTDDIGTAVFAGIVGFLVFNAVQTPFIKTDTSADGQTGTATFLSINISGEFSKLAYKSVGNVLGIKALNTSIFAGIVAGYIIAKLYNRYHTIQLPSFISFFSGKRFVAFVAIMAMLPLAFIFLLVWPFVGYVFGIIGENVGKVAGLDSFAFGYIERALVPTGLHHVFYSPLWYTSAGGDPISAINNSGATILAINGGSITVDGANQDAIVSLMSKLGAARLNPVNGAAEGALVFASAADAKVIDWARISATYNSWLAGGKASALTAAQVTQIFSEVNASATSVLQSNAANVTNDIQVLATAVKAKAVVDLNGVLTSSIAKSANNTGDSFAWLAVNASGINEVTFTRKDSTTQETMPIFQFLDRVADLRLGRFVQGKYSFMQFGLTAAGAAMIMAAPKENRRLAASIVIPAALTSFTTGVTEPIEFTFLFLAPYMFWGFHAIMAAFSFLLMNLAHAHMGMTFSGGIIDTIVYGIIPVQKGTEFWWSFVIGVGYAPIYYFVFYYVIKRMNLATPGRGTASRLFTKKDVQAKADEKHAGKGGSLSPREMKTVLALGGWDNITKYTNCATRLRYDVKDARKVDTEALKAAGAAGVIKVGSNHVQVIVGTEAEIMNTRIKEHIGAPLGGASPVAEVKPAAAPHAPAHSAKTKAAHPQIKRRASKTAQPQKGKSGKR